jgi:tetratricopeptide (TPR) repeat protein
MTWEVHENLERLRRLFAGEGAPGEIERAAAHITGCRPCWMLAARALAAERAEGSVVLRGVLRSVADLQEAEQARLEEWLEALAAWAEIRPLDTKERRNKARFTRSLHTRAFFEVLLAEGEGSVSPTESEECFHLALLVAVQLPAPPFTAQLKNDLCAACCAEIANARRRQARWPAAKSALQQAAQYIEKGGQDGVVRGKLLWRTAALESDLGNLQDAAALLRQAIVLFDAAAEQLLLSTALAQLAYLHLDTEPAESIRIIEQCLSCIPPESTRLAVFAESIKIDCLMALGAPQEALLRFHRLTPLYEQFHEPLIQVRRQFTAGRLLEHLGRAEKAERIFEEVIAADLEHGHLKDFFMDLAYLFGFFLRAERRREAIAVCRRAAQELAILDGEEGGASAHEQMRLVWQTLEESVRRGKVTLHATTILRSYLTAHWRQPASELPSFQEP